MNVIYLLLERLLTEYLKRIRVMLPNRMAMISFPLFAAQLEQ